MYIKSIGIKNFRLLHNIENLEFNKNHTIIVWRNNSWKTSLTELFKKFFNDWSKFDFNDFSICTHVKLKESLKLYMDYEKEIEDEKERGKKYNIFEESIPEIILIINFKIEEDDDWLDFRGDLEDSIDEYKICLKLVMKNKIWFYQKIKELYWDEEDFKIINYIKNNFEWNFEIQKFVIDSSNLMHKLNKDIGSIFNTSFINAQRDLDDNSSDKNNTLSKIFENYFKKNTDLNIEKGLDTLLSKTNDSLDGEYLKFFKVLQEDLWNFWYPWLSDKDRKLSLKAELSAVELMKWNNSKIYYSNWDYQLPESYNGLWYSNLIYIILQFSYLYWEFIKLKPIPQFQLLFIEEPEAHLHPQMQQTFIKQIEKFINSKWWNVQIVLTTHSSHIITCSDFTKIRYFKKENSNTEVKDLNNFNDEWNFEFLKKYLTLEKSDIFFADKLILIEWMVERILLPLFILNIDNEIENIHEKLTSQYISIIEVWWAYSHKFKNFLEFIWIKTLIITDIDSVDKKTKEEKILLWFTWKKIDSDDSKECSYKVSEWKYTSNYTLINWIPWKKELSVLLSLAENSKIVWNYRVAYQIEENWNTWRSFEEAFILANYEKLENYSKESIILKNKFSSLNKDQVKEKSWEISSYIDNNSLKTDFAFDVLMMESFIIPKYIKEGLIWLSK